MFSLPKWLQGQQYKNLNFCRKDLKSYSKIFNFLSKNTRDVWCFQCTHLWWSSISHKKIRKISGLSCKKYIYLKNLYNFKKSLMNVHLKNFSWRSKVCYTTWHNYKFPASCLPFWNFVLFFRKNFSGKKNFLQKNVILGIGKFAQFAVFSVDKINTSIEFFFS